MASDWWSRKLGGGQPQHSAPQPHGYPPVRPMPTPQQREEPSRFYRPHYLEPLHEGERQSLLDPQRDPNAQIPFSDALQLWRGGEAHRMEGGQVCPSCGSGLVFSRANAGTIRGASPAPHCFECGWSGGLIPQQGSPPA